MINQQEIDPNTGVADVKTNPNLKKPKLQVSLSDYDNIQQIGRSLSP